MKCGISLLMFAYTLALVVSGDEILQQPSRVHNNKLLAECLGKMNAGSSTLERWTACRQELTKLSSAEIRDRAVEDSERVSHFASAEEVSGSQGAGIFITVVLCSILLLLLKLRARARSKRLPEESIEEEEPTEAMGTKECLSFCAPLGLAFATTLIKMLNGDSLDQESLLEDELPKILECELQEALFPVLGEQSEEFARALKKSFVTYYKLMTSGQRRKTSSRSEGVKLVSNTHQLHVENHTFKLVCSPEKQEEDAVSTNQEVTQSFQVQDVSLSRASSDITVHSPAPDDKSLGPDNRIQSAPYLPSDTFPYAVGTAAGSSNLSQAFLSVLERSVEAQERLNHLTWIGLLEKGEDRSRRLTMKKEEIELAMKTTNLMKESNELKRSHFDFEVMEAQKEATLAGCRQLCKRCGDDLVAGMIVMVMAVGYGTWKQSPRWIFDLIHTCQPQVKEKPRFAWQYMSWSYSLAEELGKSSLCLLRGALGMVLALVAFFFVSSTIFKRLLSTPTESAPGTMLILVGGGLIGYAGQMIVDLLGGDGLTWLILWGTLCCCHAAGNFYSKNLVNRFQKRGGCVLECIFHLVLAFALPATMGFAAFPEAWPTWDT